MSKIKSKKNDKSSFDSDELNINTGPIGNYIPQLVIPFSIIDTNNKANLIPRQIDEGVYRLRAAKELHLDVGNCITWHSGIKLSIPKYIDVSPYIKTFKGSDAVCFPRCVLYGHVGSIFSKLNDVGLEVLGPTVITAEMANDSELVVYLRNIGKQICVIKAGDEMAELSFSLAPISTMKLIQVQEN